MINIIKNPNGDTRTAPGVVDFYVFREANDMHRDDVLQVMKYLSTLMIQAGSNHDFTKKSEEVYFYNNFTSAIMSGADFTEGEWYKYHVDNERHHLLSRCPEDVNLIDVIEMISDCVCAGLARSETVPTVELPAEMLQKAIDNTIKLISSQIRVINDINAIEKQPTEPKYKKGKKQPTEPKHKTGKKQQNGKKRSK